jgi:hypothetical protein
MLMVIAVRRAGVVWMCVWCVLRARQRVARDAVQRSVNTRACAHATVRRVTLTRRLRVCHAASASAGVVPSLAARATRSQQQVSTDQGTSTPLHPQRSLQRPVRAGKTHHTLLCSAHCHQQLVRMTEYTLSKVLLWSAARGLNAMRVCWH